MVVIAVLTRLVVSRPLLEEINADNLPAVITLSRTQVEGILLAKGRLPSETK